MVIHELKNYETELGLLAPWREWTTQSIDEFVIARQRAREKHQSEMANVSAEEPRARRRSILATETKPEAKLADAFSPEPIAPPVRRAPRQKSLLSRRRNDKPGKLVPKRPSQYVDRRGMPLLGGNGGAKYAAERRRKADRRKRNYAIPFPDRRLTRSAYEQVFLKLVSGGRLRMGNDIYTPVGMKGWYHAIFRRESDGAEKLLSIDQLLKKMGDWT
jgi:hypothetical protein